MDQRVETGGLMGGAERSGVCESLSTAVLLMDTENLPHTFIGNNWVKKINARSLTSRMNSIVG